MTVRHTTMQEIGTLVVVVLKARNLPDKHSLYKQDVFSQVVLGGNTKATKIDIKGGQHPVWDEELRFPIYQKTKQEDRLMEVSCWRKEPRGAECIGKGTVDVEETLRTGEFDDWIKLEESGTYRGDLYLEMTYYAAGPVPLQRRKTKMPASDRLVRSSQAYAYPGLQQGRSSQPPQASRPSTSLVRNPQATPAYNMGASAHLSPPTSTHTSPRTSPRSKYDALPPIPQDHLPTQSIPDILRPGNPKGDIHYSEKPHPRDSTASHISHSSTPPAYGAYTAVSVSPPQSPPRGPVTIPPSSSPPGAPSVPVSLRAGPPLGRNDRSASSSPPGPAINMLPPQSPIHVHYPTYPPSTPSLPLPGPQRNHPSQGVPNSYAPPPVAHTGLHSSPPYSQGPAAYRGNAPPPQAEVRSQYYSAQSQSNTQYYTPQDQPHAHRYPQENSYSLPSFPVPSFPVAERYTTPLPLPDEPEGIHTPTPTHREPHLQPLTPAPAVSPAQDPRRAARTRSLEERDKSLALELEREEEARRREAEERDRADEELARKLDLEFNLVTDEDPAGHAGEGRSAPTQTQRPSADSGSHVPGAW